MNWVYKVLAKKGVDIQVIERISRLYKSNTTVVVVNNIHGKAYPNLRGSLRQGDVPSMYWFAIGIDPLLVYLDKRLDGIPVSSLPVFGPQEEQKYTHQPLLPRLEQRYKLIAYADDVKPSISSMNEFRIVDMGCSILEKASGVKLHRDPSAGKVKFLPLGRWKGTLSQEDIPQTYIKLSDHLDFLGVELKSTFIQTRKVNGDHVQTRVSNIVGPWKSGRFMPLTLRPFSANTYALSKVWFKCSTINLRRQDIMAINSTIKSWLYQDMLEKPNELVLYRGTKDGGLGLLNVEIRALACLIKSFLETAADKKFRNNLFHNHLYRYHVQREHTLPDPGVTPYYSTEFFDIIRSYYENMTINIETMSLREWYQTLLEDRILMTPAIEDTPRQLIPVRAERLAPSNDWVRSWQTLQNKGLTSDHRSFLFRMLHGLLPTQARLSHLRLSDQDQGLCILCKTDVEDIIHAFFQCPNNHLAGLRALGWAQVLVPNLSQEDAVLLRLGDSLTYEEESAVSQVLAISLKFIWEARIMKKVVSIFQVRSELEANISILRKASRPNIALLVEQMLNI